MTEEMKLLDTDFQNFLKDIDKKYADYFNSEEAQRNGITSCFATFNGANLKYAGHSLRPDIYNEVVNKHKEIWGKWHHFDVL